MDTQITIATIGGLLGITFGIWSWLKSRDKERSEKDKEATEVKIKLDIYKAELEDLKKRVDNLDIKVMQKIEDLSNKIDKLMLTIINKIENHDK
jgi:hypothetical protein